MAGPHIFGFSLVALCISFTSALASARLPGSATAAINADTLNLLALVLFPAILSASVHASLTMLREARKRSLIQWFSGVKPLPAASID
jgi:hypothetical protein